MRPIANLRRANGVRALRHRKFRLLWTGQLVSLVGTWMQQVAQAWLVLTLTGDPLALGLLAAAQFGPVLVFGLFGGILADMFPKRRVLLVTQSRAPSGRSSETSPRASGTCLPLATCWSS